MDRELIQISRQLAFLEYLRKRADEGCDWRGHSVAWSKPFFHINRYVQDGICSTCKAEVRCDSGPPPNGIDIGGSAVALNCPIKD